MKSLLLLVLFSLLGLTLASDPFPYDQVSLRMRIGGQRGAVRMESIEQTVEHKGADWIRLVFDKTTTNAPLIRITSLKDGASQHLTPVTLAQWQYTSAYFNGDAVLVELFDEAGHAADYVIDISSLMVGRNVPSSKEKSLCGPDSRELSSYKRSGRYLGSGGCTGWLINDRNNCFLSAQHCGTDSTGGGVMEFEVPLSEETATGHRIVHPAPEHQYSLDPRSLIQASGNVGVGNDWQYFGCYANSETGLTPFQRQGESYILSTNLTSPTQGTVTTIIGYGVVEFDKPEPWNQAQKVSHGPFSHSSQSNQLWTLHYTVDTTGGDSGSAIEQNGYAVGVHTHGGCSRLAGGTNSGTFLGQPGLQAALKAPAGICAN